MIDSLAEEMSFGVPAKGTSKARVLDIAEADFTNKFFCLNGSRSKYQFNQKESSSRVFIDCVIFAAYTATPLFIAGVAALYPSLWLGMLVGTAAICYTVYLLYQGIPIFMDIPSDEGFLFSSSVLAVGLVVLVAMMATSVIFWGFGVGPVYLR